MYNTLTIPSYSVQSLYVRKDQIKKDIKNKLRTIKQDDPEFQKWAIDKVMTALGKSNVAYDANELWKASAYNFQLSAEYISQNGYLLSSISSLPPNLQVVVRNKVKDQLNVADSKGILVRPELLILAGFVLYKQIGLSIEWAHNMQKQIE